MLISILVACCSPMETEVLCAALKQHRKNFDVVGSASSTKELLKQVAEHQPQVTLISADLQDGQRAGLNALRQLHASNCSTRPVVMLNCADPDKVVEAFSLGARGVICKTSSVRVLCKCLRSVHAGQIWADSTQLEWIFGTLGEREPVRIVSAKGIPLLTTREEQIVHLVAEGLPNQGISSKLGVSPHTVKNHLFRIYEKLGVSNRVELVLYALSSHQKSRGSSAETLESA